MFHNAALVAAKDLRIEARSKTTLGQIAPFAFTVLLLFAFAIDPDRSVLTTVAPGLFWIAVLLSTVLAVQRSFVIETAHNARDGLRLTGMDPASIFIGKAGAIAVQLFALEVVLAAGVVVLYGVTLDGALLLSLTCLLATIGLATTGTVYGALSSSMRVRETLLPVLFLPIVAPVLLAAARASEAALGTSIDNGAAWVQVLAVFTVIYTAIGVLAFGPLMEDA